MMRRTTHRKPSKLALTLSLFFLATLTTASDSTSPAERRSWRPDSEQPGAKFVLGDGKTEGSKVKGYEGEWPLWSSSRKTQSSANHANPPEASNSVAPQAGSSNSTAHVCSPIGDCEPCPEDVIHLPYCRPYNNRRRVACSPVTDRNDPQAVQSALRAANSAKTDTSAANVRLGYEACGKSAKQEARDYFEMIGVIASIAIFSVWAFVQRQKLLFRRQNQRLQSRVTGRRSSGIPTGAGGGAGMQGRGKKRAARLAIPSGQR
ncbi:hypothetical protein PHSY_000005 [Pseudozyma hubeiensis SY62]|uniref:Uncharacterized protein n=1 Tax=Pseudozyma hubeiensis (strain SY62) TaxID=1305764 RepID=R9NVN0_PSEHS|nr:hypothetical protein PHSY_000005 [Pseudozyma hubeiensis SY62]GAC92452.1 hypothetical protein PHSY_000005 [Pseudozyma hubeiensis SY62]